MFMWLLLGCPHAPLVQVSPPAQHPVQFAIQSRVGTMAGAGVITTREDGVELAALTPVGVELFRVVVREGAVEVEAVDPHWADMLQRLPWQRDLGLLHQWSCEDRCAVPGGGRVHRSSADTLRYRGPGGPAVVTVEQRKASLHDGRRGYTLVVVGGTHGR